MERPNILEIKTGYELKKWYWLKSELIAFAKIKKVNYTGAKFEILDRLVHALDGKNTVEKNKNKPTSKFNWAKEKLTLETLITDSYKNGSHTRQFFKEHCGEKFAFSIPFMAWMKANVGKNLKNAVQEWERIQNLQKDKNSTTKIPESNQYNQYIRDFFADNPTKTINEARNFWKLKRKLPVERHKYERTDLKLKDV